MSKGFNRSTLPKVKQTIVERELPPKVAQDKDKSLVLLCPFCQVPHVLQANKESACGSVLRVTVVQPMFKSKFEKDMICAKCGKNGGLMVKMNNGFIHAQDCKPGLIALNDAPEFSKLAKFMYGLKDGKLKSLLKKNFGVPTIVREMDLEGKTTGNILGYVFYRSEQNDTQPPN